MEKRVAYYAHHHGSGHIRHAIDFAETVDGKLLVLSTRELPSADMDHVSYIRLPDDAIEGYRQPSDSPFHYTPSDPGIRLRFQTLANALHNFKPDVVIVDVSVEVAVFVKLLGYPVIFRLMHGNRNDRAHEIAYRMADKLIAYYPKLIEQPDRADWLMSKVTYIGMREIVITQRLNTVANSVCVVTSTGGEGLNFSDLEYACREAPDWNWTVIGIVSNYQKGKDTLPKNCILKGYVEHADKYLSSAEVIVSASGHNAVSRSVAHRKPVILCAEVRPFQEQHYFAHTISKSTNMVYITSWRNTDWTQVLRQARLQNTQATATNLLCSDKTYGEKLKQAIEDALAAAH